MITYISINGFKTFRNFEMFFSPFTVIAGTNASGKSNLFDAMSLLSDLATDNSIQKVLASQRGNLDELFTLFDNGQRSEEMTFVVEMLVNPVVVDEWGQTANLSITRLRYELSLRKIGLEEVAIIHEALLPVRKKNDVWADYLPDSTDTFWRPIQKGVRKKPFMSVSAVENGKYQVDIFDNNKDYLIKTPSKGLSIKKPNVLIIGSSSKTIISRFDNVDNPHLLAARQEMMSWRFLHLNPTDLRLPSIKSDMSFDLDASGRNMASTLVRLKKEDPYNLNIISRLIRKFIPDYVGIDVREEADGSRYIVYVEDRKHRDYSSRVLSEGTLRILALCILAVDSHHSGLLCFEEPENGVHPSRLAVMAELMQQLSSDFQNTELKLRQVIVNTHSPRFVEEVFKLKNVLSLVVLARRVASVINEGPIKTMLQTTRMTPVVSDGKHVFPLCDQPSVSELSLNRQDMQRYLNRMSIDDLLDK